MGSPADPGMLLLEALVVISAELKDLGDETEPTLHLMAYCQA